ncbi:MULTISPECIES: 3-hydroxyacyl-CoA dehydrogenase/enoyl-CoA hydratase family protein [Bacillus]|uniref:3-hydroxyacyl-CoA dehydrogenase n=2 Tax=Bacillus TaxID=1386 RepID=A0A0M3R9Z7_9BACI|nr:MULTISPECIES: 3-hydroxyacyl-CoA dehydrogenase/enoyl-CoA hydratase family protein [Bacillus]ALC82296.1 3-hydroxyacyl-CoA dehydrogenase [Bacillus gobiensis]MBP1081157.1 3-hydroxyacyl-CoA dehydrogenase [Bacillus capparidis]MED1095839.1 3-hydroxyacyl-CoA dehydrogenase NAD-binding domain-containing protein [Bacillus capparidis]
MKRHIGKAAVIGSGVMGSGIAAHLANTGIPVLLIDRVPNELTEDEKQKGLTLSDDKVRNRLGTEALQKLVKQKPAPLTSTKNLAYLTVGNLLDHADSLNSADWIIEVVVENLEVKKEILALIDEKRKPGSIVSSNTSGISVNKMAEGRSADFKKHFLGTHFFNPARYLKLLEVIPIRETDPCILDFMKTFGEDVLGKGIVEAKDTPNFIANRIGTYGLLVTIKEMIAGQYSVGDIDSITGPLIGRPKSATFRTLDVVGLDTFSHVAKNVYEHATGEEKEIFTLPSFVRIMLENGWIGSKANQGFYKKEGNEILELDPVSMTYHARTKLDSPGIQAAKSLKGAENKMKALIFSDDKAGELLWKLIAPVLVYSAKLIGEISDDISAIDNAMKWGFGWQHGPFEIWDILGVEKITHKLQEEGAEVPAVVTTMLGKGHESFYLREHGKVFFYNQAEYRLLEQNKNQIHLAAIKRSNGVIQSNNGASLIDIGDDVALLEFHSKSNAIGMDIIQMIHASLEEVDTNYKGLVIGNQGKNFCVGANLALILMEAQDENFYEIEFVIRRFQDAMMKIKYSKKPVVAAPFAMTLGGGTEVCLPAGKICAASETYMGLVEVGVGLIPGGGGNKELYLHHIENLPEGVEFDYQKAANRVFETIAFAKISTSAQEAREYSFLRAGDLVISNQDHLIHHAKQQVISLFDQGYHPPVPVKIPVTGETGFGTMLLGAEALKLSGYISEYDMNIAKKLAYVIAGGNVPFGTKVSEEYLLDLEREAFLSLAGEAQSQQRMQHMLVKGKPLRN